MLDFSLKAESVQKERCAQIFSVIHLNDIGGFLYIFKDGHVQIFKNGILLIIAEKCVLALDDRAGIRRKLTRDDVQERGLSASVPAENADFFALAERVRKIGDDGGVTGVTPVRRGSGKRRSRLKRGGDFPLCARPTSIALRKTR